MGGDGMGGLALAIGIAIIAMVICGFLIFYFISRMAGSSKILALVLGLVGMGAGVIAVYATFYEDTWAPPPKILLDLPADFKPNSVILLEDSSSPTALAWQGVEMPFFGKSVDIQIPPSGVLRVKSFGPMAGRGDAQVIWSSGNRSLGSGGGPAPSATKAYIYVYFLRDTARPNGSSSVAMTPPSANTSSTAKRDW